MRLRSSDRDEYQKGFPDGRSYVGSKRKSSLIYIGAHYLIKTGFEERNLGAPKTFDLVFVYVNAQNAVSASGKTRSRDKPHVTRSYNGYFHLLNLPGKTCEERSRRNFSATKRQDRVQQILKK